MSNMEAFNKISSDIHKKLNEETITAIKDALESKDDPWSPVSIGVDVTSKGAYVVGIYALDKDTSQIFYAKHHPAPQRTWVGLTPEEEEEIITKAHSGAGWRFYIRETEAILKARNT